MRKLKSCLAPEAPQSWHVARFGTNKVTSTVEVAFAGKEIRFSLYCMGSWQCPRNVDDSVTITKVIACSNNPALSSPSMSLPSLPLFLHAAIPRVLPSVARRVGSLSASPLPPPAPPFPSARARATRLHFLPTSPSSVRVVRPSSSSVSFLLLLLNASTKFSDWP